MTTPTTPSSEGGDGWQGSQAAHDVVAERRRQVEAEGFRCEIDDIYVHGELARAASAYAYEAGRTDEQRKIDNGIPPVQWPWGRNWWKSTDRRRDLVKAAALIIAEIERLDRASLPKPPSEIKP